MEVNMDKLSVRWKPPKEKEWRGAYQLSEKWKGKEILQAIKARTE